MTIRAASCDTEHLPCVAEVKREGKASRVSEEVSPTLRNNMGDNQTAVAYTVDMGGGKSSVCAYDTAARTLSKSQPKTCALQIIAIENDPTVKIDMGEVGFSLRAREFKDPQIICYSEKRFFEWHEDDKSVNIRASSGSYGGERSACLYQTTVGALCQTDYKWIQQQQVMQGKLIVEIRERKQCGQIGMERKLLQH